MTTTGSEGSPCLPGLNCSPHPLKASLHLGKGPLSAHPLLPSSFLGISPLGGHSRTESC